MNGPSLEVLEIQLRQIQSQINAITGHVTSRDDVSLAQEGRLRVHLEYAEQAITKAWSIVHVAAKDVAKRLTEQQRAEAAEASMRA